MTTLVRLALRNLARHKWRTLATAFGVALGIAAVLTTLSVGANVEANLRETLQAAAGNADLLVTPGAGGRAVFETSPLLEEIGAHPNVATVYPVLSTRAEPERSEATATKSIVPGVDSGFQVQGRQVGEPGAVPADLAAGALPAEGSFGIAIANGFAKARDIAVGDVIDFGFSTGKRSLLVTGLLDDAGGLASANFGRVGVMAYADLQSVLSLGGRASYLEVQAARASEVDALQADIESLAGVGFTVTFPAVSGNFTFGIVQTLQSGLLVLAATLLALGAFLAYNTFMASVVERRREYALLRTVALTRRAVVHLALTEALMVAALGVLLGVLLGVALSAAMTYLNAVTFGYEVRTLVIPVGNVLLASVLGAATAVLAALLPALAASRTPPMAALQSVDSEETKGRPLLGLLLTALGAAAALLPWSGLGAIYGTTLSIGLFFVGVALLAPALLRPAAALLRGGLGRLFGKAGKLGAAFASRNAPRNGVAISTVVIGTGLVIGVGSMVASTNEAVESWVDSTVVGDVFVTAAVPFPDDFEARTAAIPGVSVASGVKITAVRYLESEDDRRGRSVALVLVDPERFEPTTGFGTFQYMPDEGDPATTYEALRTGKVLVANTMKDRYGVGVGDEVVLRTSEGFQAFEVAGVVVDFTGGGETVVGSIEDVQLFGGGNPDLFVIVVEDGASPATVADQIATEFADLAPDVTLNADYRAYILQVTGQAFSTTRLLLVIAILVATMAVANTLGMNLVNRGHEIAVLRAIGLTRGGVQSLVLAEGVIVTVLGALLGIGFGALLARVVTEGAAALTGFHLTPTVPWSLVVIALLASPLVGLVAAMFPARRAARLEPNRALASWSENV